MRRTSSCVAILTLFSVLAVLGSDSVIIGTWLGQSDVPGAGADEFTLVFVEAGSGFAGTISDSLGVVAKETRISEIHLGADKTVTFQFPLVDGTIIFCRLAVEQDKMTGTWQHPSGNTGALEFVRKK